MLTSPTLLETTAPVITSDTLSFTYTVTNGLGNPRDWVGVFRIEDDNKKYLDWKYLANNKQSPRPTIGATSGVVNLTIKDPTPGIYQVRLNTANNIDDFSTVNISNPIEFHTSSLNITLTTPDGVVVNPDSL